jgi:putative addiction module component (TIGR02574 family)
MPTKVAQTLSEITTWPVEDQVDLLHQIWDRLAETGWQPELSEEQKAEFDRRIDAYEADPSIGLTWEDIVKHVRRPR